MATAINEITSPETRQAVKKLRHELDRLYWETFGKEAEPEIVLAEAEYLVAKHGPNFELKDLF
jgi:hypothetical protein